MLQRRTRAIALTFAILLVVSCARVGDPPIVDRIRPFLRLAVMLGTDRVLVQNRELAPMVLQVTTTLQTLFDTAEVVSLAQINAAIRAKLATMDITPEVRAVLEALLESIVIEVRLVIVQSGVADDQAVVYMRELVGWIKEAALRYVVVPPPAGVRK